MFNHCSSIYDKVNRYSQIGSYNSRFLQNSSWLADHLSLETTLDVHNGCVNSLCWTKDSGSTGILSGSDDRRLIITDVFTKKELVSVKTNHGDNIFTVRFLPNTGDLKVISGAGDGSVLLSDLSRIDDTQIGVFNCACESGPIYECRPLSMDCSQVFLTCAEDGAVRRYDTRICSGCCQSNRVNPLTRILARISGHNFSGNRQNCCRKYAIVSLRSASTTSIDLAEGRNNFEIAVGCSDGKVRIYDMRNCKKPFANYSYPIMLSRRAALPRNKCQVTCVKYNEAGNELLINFSGNQIHLVNPSCLNGSADSSKSRWMTNPPGTTTDETENEHKTQGDNEVRRIKRIRLRGDWTDTGPMARPSRESIIMIRRLSNVFNNLGISPPVSSSSSSNSSSSESENNNSSGESGDQVRLRSFIQSLVGRLSDQANDDEGDHTVDSDLQLSLPHRDRESNVSSEPDYDDDNEDDEDESILNAQFDDLHQCLVCLSLASLLMLYMFSANDDIIYTDES
ncbi:hypothetical protein GJ496_009397 [Pomphorhynchus laevis]|nr:hypothetical protein GJ496_009397 [Pomphorhynchus laevis]